jgi:hypothetical protein
VVGQISLGLYGGLALVAAVLTPVAATVALAGGLYDGNYHGSLKGAGFNAVSCAKQAPVQITVTDSKLTYVHMGNATITATVAADGSFAGTGENKYGRSGMNVQTLEGKIAGDAITAVTKVGNYCTYNLELRKFR